MRISELAGEVGVPVSTVRYYERIGLMGEPARSASGYRDYGEEAATRLLFVSRARRLGLSCDHVAELLTVWNGADCRSAYDRVVGLLDEKEAEIAAHIAELTAFAAQLQEVRESLEAAPPPHACRTDLACCMPASSGVPVPAPLGSREYLPLV